MSPHIGNDVEEQYLLQRHDRPTRSKEQSDLMIELLDLHPDMIVADVGAGTGRIAFKLAKQVAPNGTVYASEIHSSLLRQIVTNAKEQHIKNIIPILATIKRPNLPYNLFDLIIMVKVYHEVSHPVPTLKGLRKALKRNGRLILIENRPVDSTKSVYNDHTMSVSQAKLELEANGFKFIKVIELYPWQNMIIFEKRLKHRRPIKSSRL